MLEQISPLWQIFKEKQHANKPLVLVTLVKTSGSTYKKAGAMMLVEENGTTHGLISGGCLEADVAEHAKQVFDNKRTITLSYDMSDDSIFGLGAGCDGSLTLVLQLLSGDYLPFSAMNPTRNNAQQTKLFINHDESLGYPIGSYFIKMNEKLIESNDGIFYKLGQIDKILNYSPPPSIVICGAGIDTYPLVAIANLLQWHVEVIDHRPGKLAVSAFNAVDTTVVSINGLNQYVSNKVIDAVIIMTHNLNHDAAYLNFFADFPWIGLLGPISRRDKVLKLAQLELSSLNSRLHAPIGLDIGGHMPENIAVSIIAQLQHYFQES